MKRFLRSGQRFFSTVEPLSAVENPPENLPKFLSNDLLRDPKQRALELYMSYRSISYEEELRLKQRQLESRFQNVAKTLFYDRNLHPSIRKLIRTNDANLCPIREIQPATEKRSEYLTCCVADLGKTRQGDLALGLPNRLMQHESMNDDQQMMFVLPIDEIEIYKKRDRLIVQHYSEFLKREVQDVSSVENVLQLWRPIRILTNEKDQKLVFIGYFDRKSSRQADTEKAKERLENYFRSGPGKECQIDFLFFERRQQRWPLIVNESIFEPLIENSKTPFTYDLFGLKFEPNFRSIGIPNLEVFQRISGEIMKNSLLDPSSRVFVQYFSDIGVLPLTVVQNVERSYGLDPSRAAIEASIRTQSKYPHTEHVSLRNCSNRDQMKTIFEQIQNEKNDKSSVTFVFGPARNELERADLRQNRSIINVLRECDFIDRLIVVSRGINPSVLHLLYSLSGGESGSQKISGAPFKPVLIIPFDSNPRTNISADFLMIYDRE